MHPFRSGSCALDPAGQAIFDPGDDRLVLSAQQPQVYRDGIALGLGCETTGVVTNDAGTWEGTFGGTTSQ